jgi:hypothetical protein
VEEEGTVVTTTVDMVPTTMKVEGSIKVVVDLTVLHREEVKPLLAEAE